MGSVRSWLRRPGWTPAPTGAVRPSPSYGVPAEAAPVDLQARLVALREEHVERVNCAVAEGRLDLVQELVDDYTDEALAALTAAPRTR